MKLDIYGKMEVEVFRKNGEWIVLVIGNEGKSRPYHDAKIPSSVKEEQLIEYLEDVFHEWATPANYHIRRIIP